jgi:hypothetical protein
MEGWRLLHQVPQLKWTLVAKGTPVLNESELAILILRILIQMTAYYPSRDADGAVIRPLPTVMRVLSEPNALPHIVQLLVTFDPVLGERGNCRIQVSQSMLRQKNSHGDELVAAVGFCMIPKFKVGAVW